MSGHSLEGNPGKPRKPKACIACHDNKTRCDGTIGTQCSLCRKRGIDCRYTVDKSRVSRSPAEPDPPQTHAKESKAPVPTGDAAFDLISIEDMDTSFSLSSQDLGSRGLDDLLKNISECSHGLPEKRRILNGSAPRQAVLDKLLEAYLGKFHVLWPIIHQPTFDLEDIPLALCAIVCLVGAYCCDMSASSPRITVISRSHENMLDNYLQDLCARPNLDPDSEPWPFTTYQAILLTIIFATYTGEEATLQKARRLTDLLTTSLRAAEFFSSETAKTQGERHFPGPWPPWRFMIGEQQRRIAAHLFKVDAHLALISQQQPPALRACELDVPLPSALAQVTGRSLGAHHVRQAALQHVRKETLLASFLETPAATFGASTILVEDVHIGLCGLAAKAWRLAQTRRQRRPSDGANLIYRELTESLRFWRSHLQILRVAVGSDPLLRSAYHYQDDRPDDNAIRAILDETLALYHLLSLLVRNQAPSDILSLDAVHTTQLPSTQGASPGVLPPEAVTSFFHAICIGALNLKLARRNDGCCRPPILRHAVIIAQEYVTSMLGDSCWCAFSGSKIDLALADAQIEREDAICGVPLGGIFWLFVEGQPLCACDRSSFLLKAGLLEGEGRARG